MHLSELLKKTCLSGGKRVRAAFIVRESQYVNDPENSNVLLVYDRYSGLSQGRWLNADLGHMMTHTIFRPTAEDLMADDWISVPWPEWARLMPIDKAIEKALEKKCCIVRFENYIEHGARMSVINPGTSAESNCFLTYIRDGEKDNKSGWCPSFRDLYADDWMLVAGPEERYSPAQIEKLHEADEDDKVLMLNTDLS